MNGWDVVKTVLPTVATALGGPLAGLAVEAVGKAIGMSEPNVEKVKDALSGMTTEQRIALQGVENDLKIRLAQMGYDNIQKLEALAAQNATDVNKSIQAETTAERWPQYSWRPFIGFAFGFNLIQCSVVTGICYIGGIFFGHAELITNIPAYVIAITGLNGTALPILGIASWFRGKMQADPEIPPATKAVK